VLAPVGLRFIFPVAVKLVKVALVGVADPMITLLIVPGTVTGAIVIGPVIVVVPLTVNAVNVPRLVKLLLVIPLPSVVAVNTILLDPNDIVPEVTIKFPLIVRFPLESTV